LRITGPSGDVLGILVLAFLGESLMFEKCKLRQGMAAAYLQEILQPQSQKLSFDFTAFMKSSFPRVFFGLPSCFCTINGRLSWPPQDVPSCYFNSWELTKPRSWMLLSTASSKLELGSPSILQKDLSKVHVLRTNHDDLKSFIFFMFGGV